MKKLGWRKILRLVNRRPAICAAALPPPNPYPSAISKDLHHNYREISSVFQHSSDVIIRKFRVANGRTEAMIVSMEGMSEYPLINEGILGSLMRNDGNDSPPEITIEYLKNSAISLNGVREATTLGEAVEAVLKGNTAFFLDGSPIALIIKTQAWEHRGVQTSKSEINVRGPREGFTETLSVNISQVRRRIRDQELRIETLQLGRRTRTEVCIVYIGDIANPKIVAEVRQRLGRIDLDAVLESGYIEELIEDAPFSIFPTVGNTETPDKFVGKVLEGRVGILVDGTPIALTVPYLFIESFQVAEDYYSRSFLVSLLRIIRIIAIHITITLPALYVAIITFHPNVLPEPLLRTIALTREGVPFPAFVEALMMGFFYEAFREGITHLPQNISQSVSIIGALVLGQAVVNAGIVSPVMLIIFSVTAVMGFLLPPVTDSITLLRIPVLLMGSFFGLFGILWCYLFVIIHLASLRSFGTPYMSPFMPLTFKDWKDALVRLPWSMLKTRPRVIDWKGSERIAEGLRPGPPSSKKAGDDE